MPGRINKKLEINYDYDVKGMIGLHKLLFGVLVIRYMMPCFVVVLLFGCTYITHVKMYDLVRIDVT